MHAFKPRNKNITTTIIVVMLCSSISLMGGLGLGLGINEIFDSSTMARDISMKNQPAAPGQILFEDKFDQENWEVIEDADHRKTYEQGQYHILAETPGFDYWSTAGEMFSDFALELETSQLAGPKNNSYGVLLRYQDPRNFYKFEISGDGFYSFSKVIDGQLYDIIPWQGSNWLEPGNSQNKLRIEAAGSQFTFYINDQRVDSVVDPAFSQGDIGVTVGAFDRNGVHISFDNLRVMSVGDR